MKPQDYTDFHKRLLSQMMTISFLLFTTLCSLIPSPLFAQMEWICATDSAEWTPRYGHTSVVFDNKIWVIGGYDSSGYKNDVWCSIDGINWNCITDSTEWEPRKFHTSVVFDNKMWVLGGYRGAKIRYNDVWYSSDGVNWTLATASAGWSARSGYASIVYNDKIWVLGGFDNSYKNDVWYSSDGVNWICATSSAEWPARWFHTSVVFNNRIWVLGGGSIPIYSDVWYSEDGENWICATDSAGWAVRHNQSSIVFNNKIWVLGGTFINDVWYSEDGENWTCATDSAGWAGRFFPTTVVLDNKMWMLGGYDFHTYYNDVWYTTGLGIEEESALGGLDALYLTPEIYPNPAKSVIRVRVPPTFFLPHQWGEDRRRGIKIFDVSGKLIKEIATLPSVTRNDDLVKISLKGINPGVYIIQLGTITRKLIVTK